MPDMFNDAESWLADTLIAHGSVVTRYQPLGMQPVEVRAHIGKSLFRVEEDGISKVVWTDRDFVYRVSDLKKLGVGEPKLGDKINEVRSVGFQTIDRWYLVSAPGGEQPFRQASGRDNLIRVHTKLDSEEVIG